MHANFQQGSAFLNSLYILPASPCYNASVANGTAPCNYTLEVVTQTCNNITQVIDVDILVAVSYSSDNTSTTTVEVSLRDIDPTPFSGAQFSCLSATALQLSNPSGTLQYLWFPIDGAGCAAMLATPITVWTTPSIASYYTKSNNTFGTVVNQCTGSDCVGYNNTIAAMLATGAVDQCHSDFSFTPTPSSSATRTPSNTPSPFTLSPTPSPSKNTASVSPTSIPGGCTRYCLRGHFYQGMAFEGTPYFLPAHPCYSLPTCLYTLELTVLRCGSESNATQVIEFDVFAGPLQLSLAAIDSDPFASPQFVCAGTDLLLIAGVNLGSSQYTWPQLGVVPSCATMLGSDMSTWLVQTPNFYESVSSVFGFVFQPCSFGECAPYNNTFRDMMQRGIDEGGCQSAESPSDTPTPSITPTVSDSPTQSPSNHPSRSITPTLTSPTPTEQPIPGGCIQTCLRGYFEQSAATLGDVYLPPFSPCYTYDTCAYTLDIKVLTCGGVSTLYALDIFAGDQQVSLASIDPNPFVGLSFVCDGLNGLGVAGGFGGSVMILYWELPVNCSYLLANVPPSAWSSFGPPSQFASAMSMSIVGFGTAYCDQLPCFDNMTLQAMVANGALMQCVSVPTISGTPTATFVPSQTPTNTPTSSPTASLSFLATPSNTPSISQSSSQTPTGSTSKSGSITESMTPSGSVTPSNSQTPTATTTLTGTLLTQSHTPSTSHSSTRSVSASRTLTASPMSLSHTPSHSKPASHEKENRVLLWWALAGGVAAAVAVALLLILLCIIYMPRDRRSETDDNATPTPVIASELQSMLPPPSHAAFRGLPTRRRASEKSD